MSQPKARPEPRVSTKENLAHNVVVLRARNGLSQAELATRAGISRAMVFALERGRGADLEILDRLAEALGVDVTELVVCYRTDAPTDDAELATLAAETDAIDARTLIASIDEAAGHPHR